MSFSKFNNRMKKPITIVIFLVVNFLALGIGSAISADEVTGNWYNELEKASWTPPGWFFGFAWTSIMILFSVFMAQLSMKREKFDRTLILMFSIQWVFNVAWNYIFFEKQLVLPGLLWIISLFFIICWFTREGFRQLDNKYAILILPYLVWLVVATSLNAYIFIYN